MIELGMQTGNDAAGQPRPSALFFLITEVILAGGGSGNESGLPLLQAANNPLLASQLVEGIGIGGRDGCIPILPVEIRRAPGGDEGTTG